jgi:hypothetical protein
LDCGICAVIDVSKAYCDLRPAIKIYARKKRHYQIVRRDAVKHRRFAIVCLFKLREQIDNEISLAVFVLDVVVVGFNAEFFKLVFESATLLEEAMNFAYFHSAFGFSITYIVFL